MSKSSKSAISLDDSSSSSVSGNSSSNMASSSSSVEADAAVSSTSEYQPNLNISSISLALKFDPKVISFGIWKMKVSALFTSYGLVSALVTAPSEDVPSSRMSLGGKAGVKKRVSGDASTSKKAELAYTILLMSLQTEQLQMIQHVAPGNAYAVWQVLLDHYESKTVASKIHVRKQLSNCKMESSELFETYVSRIKKFVIQLEEMNEHVSQSELICVL